MSLAGRTAVVTGGSSGIGRAIALTLGRAGANVVVVSRSPGTKPGDYGEQPDLDVVELLLAEGCNAIFFKADVTRPDELALAADFATGTYGSLDIWVNNAGIVPPLKPFWEFAEDEVDAMLAVNAKGVWAGMRAATRVMLQQGKGGSIVNVLSTAALKPHPDQAIYNMSKAAAAQATRCAAVELGPRGIRVNAVCPSVVRTAVCRPFVDQPEFRDWFRSITPLGEVIDVADVADAVAFLAGPAAAKITGALLPIDSGESLGPPSSALASEPA